MAARNEYVEFVLEWLSPLGEISERKMMGGRVLYCDGVVFALMSGDNRFYLKVDDVTRPQFQALGLEPFRPFADQPSTMSYYPPPAEFFEDSDLLKTWGRDAVAVGRRALSKKAKPRKKK